MFAEFHPGLPILKECKVNQSPIWKERGAAANKKVSIKNGNFC
jgi:hypothetical protein